jgi:choline dehydrogenase
VLLLEEGAAHLGQLPDMDEARACASCTRRAARATSDGAIAVPGALGRGLDHRQLDLELPHAGADAEVLGRRAEVVGHGVDDMKPWFEKMERDWTSCCGRRRTQQQRAQARLRKLGWEAHSIPRNVRGCWNSGYCGFGCPVNAKQSMLVSTIPEALRHGATLVHRVRVRQLQHADDKITGAVGEALREDGARPAARW